MKEGDLCSNCEKGRLERLKQRGKNTGNLICPVCWARFTPNGVRFYARKKPKISIVAGSYSEDLFTFQQHSFMQRSTQTIV